MNFCKCGCPDFVHHTSLTFATNGDGERVISGQRYGECLRYGSNEVGGMRPTFLCRLFPPPKSELGVVRRTIADALFNHGVKWYVVHCRQFERQVGAYS